MTTATDFEVVAELFDIRQFATRRAFDPHVVGGLLVGCLLTRRKCLWSTTKEFFHRSLPYIIQISWALYHNVCDCNGFVTFVATKCADAAGCVSTSYFLRHVMMLRTYYKKGATLCRINSTVSMIKLLHWLIPWLLGIVWSPKKMANLSPHS